MPYKDPDVARSKARERGKRYREREHEKKFGPGAGDQRGHHGNQVKGSAHPRFRGGTSLSSHGYLKIQVGQGHPLADPNGYAYAHILCWVSAGGDRPENGQVVHHANEDKLDNRISNLEMITRGEHAEIHLVRRCSETGRFVSGRLLDGREHSEFPEVTR